MTTVPEATQCRRNGEAAGNPWRARRHCLGFPAGRCVLSQGTTDRHPRSCRRTRLGVRRRPRPRPAGSPRCWTRAAWHGPSRRQLPPQTTGQRVRSRRRTVVAILFSRPFPQLTSERSHGPASRLHRAQARPWAGERHKIGTETGFRDFFWNPGNFFGRGEFHVRGQCAWEVPVAEDCSPRATPKQLRALAVANGGFDPKIAGKLGCRQKRPPSHGWGATASIESRSWVSRARPSMPPA